MRGASKCQPFLRQVISCNTLEIWAWCTMEQICENQKSESGTAAIKIQSKFRSASQTSKYKKARAGFIRLQAVFRRCCAQWDLPIWIKAKLGLPWINIIIIIIRPAYGISHHHNLPQHDL